MEDHDRQYMYKKVRDRLKKAIQDQGQASVDDVAKVMKSDWCKAALTEARLLGDLGANRFKEALKRVDAYQDASKRARFRYLLAKHMAAAPQG